MGKATEIIIFSAETLGSGCSTRSQSWQGDNGNGVLLEVLNSSPTLFIGCVIENTFVV